MRGRRIPLEKPVYVCEECGSKKRKVNVVGGRVLCHDCTILELRRLDALDNSKEKPTCGN
jgi:hypothetical protein